MYCSISPMSKSTYQYSTQLFTQYNNGNVNNFLCDYHFSQLGLELFQNYVWQNAGGSRGSGWNEIFRFVGTSLFCQYFSQDSVIHRLVLLLHVTMNHFLQNKYSTKGEYFMPQSIMSCPKKCLFTGSNYFPLEIDY